MSNDVKDIEVTQEDAQRGRFLSLSLGQEIFALDISYVTEIVGIQPITPVPEVPGYVKGIINLRGKIIPVIDMRLKFNKPPVEYDDRTCIIVVDIQEVSVGLIVDNVLEVLTIPQEHIAPPPDLKTGIQNNYIQGVGMVEDKVILLLDCIRLISHEGKEDSLELDKM